MRGLEQIPSQIPKGTNLADTLILDLWPSDLWDNELLLLKPTHAWYLVRAAHTTQQSLHVYGICLFATPWTVACQASLSMEFSRQEYWSGLPSPSQGDLPNSGLEHASLCLLHWQVGSLPLAPPGKPIWHIPPNKDLCSISCPMSMAKYHPTAFQNVSKFSCYCFHSFADTLGSCVRRR